MVCAAKLPPRVSTFPAQHHPVRRLTDTPPHLRLGAIRTPLLNQEGRRARAGGWFPAREFANDRRWKLPALASQRMKKQRRAAALHKRFPSGVSCFFALRGL